MNFITYTVLFYMTSATLFYLFQRRLPDMVDIVLQGVGLAIMVFVGVLLYGGV